MNHIYILEEKRDNECMTVVGWVPTKEEAAVFVEGDTDGIRTYRRLDKFILIDIETCPFCGGPPDLRYSKSRYGSKIFYVKCKACGAVAPSGPSRDEAVDKWNKRD